MLQDSIRELIEPVIDAEGIELIDVECQKMKTRWLVRLYIDKDGGVTLDDCQRISHVAGDILDIHSIPPGPYTLEVSPPGLDRPLTRDKGFLKFQGEKVRIRTAEKIEGIRNFHGILLEYLMEDERRTVVLEEDGKLFRIPREKIMKAHIEADREPVPSRPPGGKRKK